MDTPLDFILLVIAAVIAGLLVPIVRKTGVSFVRLLQALLRSIWRKLSKPIYMWLGWLVTESDMDCFIGGRWGINTPVHPSVEGERKTTFADIRATARRCRECGKTTGWVIDSSIAGGLSSCDFPIENRQNKRKYFRRLKESQRMLLCGIAVPDLPPPNIRVVHCDLWAYGKDGIKLFGSESRAGSTSYLLRHRNGSAWGDGLVGGSTVQTISRSDRQLQPFL